VPEPLVPTAVPPPAAAGARVDREAYDRDLLVRRYGPRRAVVVAAVLLAVVVTWAVWAWRSATTGAVSANLLGFDDPTSDTSLVVSWSVSRDPGTTVTCQVTATDRSGAQVGVRSVTVQPRGDRTTQVVTDVRTTARGANASVGGCRTVAVATGTPGATGR